MNTCKDCGADLLTNEATLCTDCYYKRADAYEGLVSQRDRLLKALEALWMAENIGTPEKVFEAMEDAEQVLTAVKGDN